MSDIEVNLQKIKESVYGKDVRQAIHDSIRDCYEDGKAGGTDLVARERINEVNQALSAEVANVVENYNLTNNEETLWTGKIWGGGATGTLSKAISNFDYLDLYFDESGNLSIRTIPVESNKAFTLRDANISDDDGTFLSVSEIEITFTGSSFSVVHESRYTYNYGSAAETVAVTSESEENAGDLKLVKVVGRKYVENLEVSDIRIGENGKTYQSAGDAVREQISELKEQIVHFPSDGTTRFDRSKFVHGTLDSNGELGTWNHYRVATSDVLAIDRDITLTVASGFRIYAFIYNGTTLESDSGGWVTSFSVKANKGLKFVIARTTDDTSEIADIETFVDQVAVSTIITNIINNSKAYVDSPINVFPVTIYKNGTGVDVMIPRRMILFGYDNTAVSIDSSTDTIINVPSNNFLLFNLDDREFSAVPYNNLKNVQYQFIILGYANQGAFMGIWSDYQVDRVNSPLMYNSNFKTIEICNRQGSIFDTPENSLIGTKTARMYGYNRIRVSVQMTSDNVPVCFHDENLGQGKVYYNGSVVTDTTLKVHDMTYSQLLDYDFGAYQGTKYANTQISTLKEQAEQAKMLGYALDVEIKDNVYALSSTDINAVFESVAVYGMISQTNFRAYRMDTLEGLQAISNKINLCKIEYIATMNIDAVSALNTGENTVWIAIHREEASSITDTIAINIRKKNIKLLTGGAILTASDAQQYGKKFDMAESYFPFPIRYFMY